MAAHNTFDNPENIKLNELQEIKRKDGGISFILPACSVAEIILKESSPE